MWSLKFEQEVEKNRALTEALQTLTTENHQVERSRGKSRRSSVLSTFNEDDFYDALSGQQPLGGNLLNIFLTLVVVIWTGHHRSTEQCRASVLFEFCIFTNGHQCKCRVLVSQHSAV